MSTRNLRLALAIALAIGATAPAWAGSHAAAGQSPEALPAAALKNSSSLYLREAAAGPVRWQPWSNRSFALARRLKRPLLIDIGAVWCHWCHVMDETTYADPRVAALINRHYVPVKVDTDQRPDLNDYYQSAAPSFGANGGWPLTCFATPDGAPLFIAGYLPPDSSEIRRRGPGMIALLKRISYLYGTDAKFRAMARSFSAKLAAGFEAGLSRKGAPADLLEEILTSAGSSFNRQKGGFGRGPGPRFYSFPLLKLALAEGFGGRRAFSRIALESLSAMARGGVYDQLGGGFHRYSTDPGWHVPHFEKMAYDQALAIEAYSLAYEQSGRREYARVVRSIVGYVEGTLLDRKTHTFYAHQDADSFTGDDGSYYTWTIAEVRNALSKQQARAAMLYFGMNDSSRLAPDGRIVLGRPLDISQLAARLKVSAVRARQLVAEARAGMLAARKRRRSPKVDRGLLTDRNALMASAFLTAYEAMGGERVKQIALEDLDFLLAHLRAPGGGFYHVWSGSKASLGGLAADQVYMMGALLHAYQVSGRSRYLSAAKRTAGFISKRLVDPKSSLLVSRTQLRGATVAERGSAGPQVFYDQPLPAVQAAAAIAFDTLAAITSEPRYQAEARLLLDRASAMVNPGAASSLGTLGLALHRTSGREAVVAIVGRPENPATAGLLRTAFRTYRPGKVVLRVDSSRAVSDELPAAARSMYQATRGRNVPLAFVCAGKACATPVEKPEKLANVIREFGVGSGGTAGVVPSETASTAQRSPER